MWQDLERSRVRAEEMNLFRNIGKCHRIDRVRYKVVQECDVQRSCDRQVVMDVLRQFYKYEIERMERTGLVKNEGSEESKWG